MLVVLDLLTEALVPRPEVTILLISILDLKFFECLNRFTVVFYSHLLMSLIEAGLLSEDRGLGGHRGRNLERFHPTSRILLHVIFE